MRSISVLKWGLVLSGLFVAAEAQAISNYTSTSGSCSAIKAAIQAEGEVMLHWTQAPNIQHFVKAVASGASCPGGEEATQASVPASDGTCFVLVCRPVGSSEPAETSGHRCCISQP